MEVMDEATLVTFLWRLNAATEKEKLRWDTAGDSQYRFVTAIGRFGYLLTCRDNDDVNPFVFSIYRSQADGVGKPQEVATWSTEHQSTLIDPLTSLYLEVKRRTLGYHNLVSELFEDLAEIDGKSPNPDSPPAENPDL